MLYPDIIVRVVSEDFVVTLNIEAHVPEEERQSFTEGSVDKYRSTLVFRRQQARMLGRPRSNPGLWKNRRPVPRRILQHDIAPE